MTKQEYYDLLVKSAYDGTFPGCTPQGCMYRTPDGHKCAVGVLMDDATLDTIDREMLQRATVARLALYNLHIPTVEGLSSYQMGTVQDAHDQCAFAGWDASYFIARINALACFADVRKEKP